jgi:hypothetical protein
LRLVLPSVEELVLGVDAVHLASAPAPRH